MTTEARLSELEDKLTALGEYTLKQARHIEALSQRISELDRDHIAQAAVIEALTKVCAIMLPLIETPPHTVQLALTKALAAAKAATPPDETDSEYRQAVFGSLQQWQEVIAQGPAIRDAFATTQPKPWLAHSQPPQALDADDAQQRKDAS